MKQIIEAIKQRLATVPSINYSDSNWGQLDYYEDQPPVKFPCALVDFESVDYTDVARGSQHGLAQVNITVATLKLSNTSSRAPVQQREDGERIWDILEDVHISVQNWKPTPQAGSMIRRTARKNRRDDGVMSYTVTYSVEVYGV